MTLLPCGLPRKERLLSLGLLFPSLGALRGVKFALAAANLSRDFDGNNANTVVVSDERKSASNILRGELIKRTTKAWKDDFTEPVIKHYFPNQDLTNVDPGRAKEFAIGIYVTAYTQHKDIIGALDGTLETLIARGAGKAGNSPQSQTVVGEVVDKFVNGANILDELYTAHVIDRRSIPDQLPWLFGPEANVKRIESIRRGSLE